MFRFAVALLAAFGLGALIFGGNVATATGIVLLAPLFFIFKIMLFFMFFGIVSSAFWGRGRSRRDRWQGHRGSWRRHDDETEKSVTSDSDRFADWHRMAHAKEEVESWTPDEV